MIKFCLNAIASLLIFFYYSYSQRTILYNKAETAFRAESFGIYLNYLFGIYYAEFSKLPDVPNCCPSFTDGTGKGFSLGILYERHSNNNLFWGARGGINNLSGTLTDPEFTTVLVNDSLVDGEFEHILDSYFFMIHIEPYTKIKLNRASLSLGLNISLNILNKFRQKETITKPEYYGVFLENLSRTRNDTSGIIKNMNILNCSPIAGFSYELPLNEKGTVSIEPEIFFKFSFLNLIKGLNWKYSTINLGLSLRYSPEAELKPIYPEEKKSEEYIDTLFVERDEMENNFYKKGETLYKRDTLFHSNVFTITDRIFRTDTIIKKPVLIIPDIKIDISAVGYDGINTIPDITMLIEEFRYTNIHPLLNYIFFDDNSAKISERYVLLNGNDVNNFKIDRLYGTGRLFTYYNILNIIGSRLREFDKAKIYITGCNSNTGNEKNNISLSKQRAEAVARYLINNWKIHKERIIINAVNLPEEPSATDSEDGIAENRRVEITSDTEEIIAHVFTNDTLRVATPPQIRFFTKCNNDSVIINWTVNIQQGNNIIKSFSGAGKIPEIIDWKLNDDKSYMPRFAQPLYYTLSVIDKWKRVATTHSKVIHLEMKTIMDKHINREGDKKIDHYSFLLFDFDKKNLNKKNKTLIHQINKKIEKKSNLLIEGYTDRIGEENYNLELSVGRALSVSKVLKANKTEFKGYGESKQLYDNSLPEGRFYCRTVEVTIETPIEK